MKKIIFVYVIVFGAAFDLSAQKPATFYKGRGYKGYLFDTSYLVLKSIHGQQSKFTLSFEDVKIAEYILKEGLLILNKNKINQSLGCPNINKKLNKYCRQYFGFINAKGENIIWINMFWNSDLIDKAKNELIIVNDGCSYYWNIEVNITKKTLLNLKINGNG